MKRRALYSAAVTAAIAIFAAGCGSSSSSQSSSGGGSSSASSSASASSGGGIKVAPRTIGVDDLARSSPADNSVDTAIEAAGKVLGWKIIAVDAAGSPQKFATTFDAFVTQHVDAILLTSGPTTLASAAMKRAQAAGIPVIGEAGGVGPNPGVAAQYVENETKMAQQLIDYILKQNPKAQIADLTASIITAGATREQELKKAVAASSGAKIVASAEPDLTNPVVTGIKDTTDLLTAHPQINAVWAVFDNFAKAAETALRNQHSSAKLYSFFGTPQNLADLRATTPLVAVSDVDLEHTGLVAIDQLLKHFQSKAAIDPNALLKSPLTYQVTTKSNITASGPTYPIGADLATFVAKWKQEYPG